MHEFLINLMFQWFSFFSCAKISI